MKKKNKRFSGFNKKNETSKPKKDLFVSINADTKNALSKYAYDLELTIASVVEEALTKLLLLRKYL